MFRDKYFKSKNSKSFVSSYNESMHTGIMKQPFAPLSRSIVYDISSIHMKSSGSFRYAKSPESQPNLAPIFMQKKNEILPVAETLPPSTIHVPNQNNGIEQSPTSPAVLECEETTKIDAIVKVNKDPKVDQESKEVSGFEPKCIATPSTHLPNNDELEETKLLLNNQLIKLRDAASAAEKQELLYQFVMEATTCFGKSGKPCRCPVASLQRTMTMKAIMSLF